MKLLAGTVQNTNPFIVKLDIDIAGQGTVYKRLESYTPTNGDRVYILQEGDKYLCLGKVV